MALRTLKKELYKPYDRILNDVLIRTAFYTGLRNSELCNIRLQDLDLEGAQYSGQRMIYVYRGKGRKDRVVGIHPSLHRALVKYLQARPATECEYLFVSDRGKKLDNGVVAQRMQRIGAYLDVRFIAHGLRHTSATW